MKNKEELLEFLKNNAEQYAFVPTMGNLHAGHLSLIETAHKYSHNVIVSIFVNPIQFGKNEDFGTYPRTLESDLEMLKSKNVDVVYTPTVECMYECESKIWFDIPHLTHVLCGISRPHFFNGVMTVVLKFLLQINPKFIILGEKDYQQFLVIKEMVKSIGLNINVISSQTIRNHNGLALSSRNGYFQNLEKPEKINQILRDVTKNFHGDNVNSVIQSGKNSLSCILNEIDYLEFRHCETLELYKIGQNIHEYRLFFAGKIDGVRLIDNVPVLS